LNIDHDADSSIYRKIPASSTKMIVILDLIVNDAEEHRSNDIAWHRMI